MTVAVAVGIVVAVATAVAVMVGIAVAVADGAGVNVAGARGAVAGIFSGVAVFRWTATLVSGSEQAMNNVISARVSTRPYDVNFNGDSLLKKHAF